jgi:signal transduction histidine kinase
VSTPTHPLSQPLPPDVAAGESAFIRFYQRYTVFSFPWAWRRTALFGAIGVLAGASFGASHGLFVRDVGEGVEVSLATSLANLVLIGAGPLLAAFIRHRGWPRAVEQVAIVAAIITGIVLGVTADDWASQLHDSLMAAHGHHGDGAAAAPEDAHMFVRRLLDLSRDLLLLLIIGGGFALPSYFTEKKRWAEYSRRAETDLRLTVLQAQVEPHFLFNTLASVRSLVATDPGRAAQTIDALARHLRATLPKFRAETGVATSTLAEQFAICASYLELMRLRIGERLTVALDLPPELGDAPFPPLLLISLVENAVKHGVEPRPGPVQVTLRARALDADRLEVVVEDSGAGLALGMGTGTGLENVRAQLLTRFGAAASFELAGRESGGVRARLVVPRGAPP